MAKRFYELNFNSFTNFILESARYLINDKSIKTPAMPIEIGFFIHQCCIGDDSITMEMVIRWGILYELFSIIELNDESNFKNKVRNSTHFATEWLDDFLLFNWELGCFDEAQDWEHNYINPYKTILKYCKHCFKEIKPPVSINSLHDLDEHGKDCSKYYKKKKEFQRNSMKISSIRVKLNNLSSELMYLKPNEGNGLIPKIKPALEEARREFQAIAKEWFYKLKTQPFYASSEFKPIGETKKEKLYIPQNTYKTYSDYKKQLESVHPDLGEIFNNMNKENLKNTLTIADLTRRYFMRAFVKE